MTKASSRAHRVGGLRYGDGVTSKKIPSTAEVRAPVTIMRAARVGDTIELDAPNAKRLAYREINAKEAFTFVDSEGHSFRASLTELTADGGRALVYEELAGSTESPLAITLLCAVLSRQRMLPVVQKATELGCVRVVPVQSDHSVQPRELEKEKPWAWPGQALRAARQCRRAAIPEVLSVTRFADAMAAPYWRGADARFVLDDRVGATADFVNALPKRAHGANASLAVAVGPEGGWSDAERARFVEHGAEALSLGVRVLRAETAVFAALSVLQHRFGDLR